MTDQLKSKKQVPSFALDDEGMTPLGNDYRPGPLTVICGRGKQSFNHPGNKSFRTIVESYIEDYEEAHTKLEKSIVVSQIVNVIRNRSPHGSFVKEDPDAGMWYEVTDRLAREKVGQSLRDALHTHYRSSTEAKKKRRKVEQERQSENMASLIDSNPQVSAVMSNLFREVTQEDLSDFKVSKMFDEANIAILEEFKRGMKRAKTENDNEDSGEAKPTDPASDDNPGSSGDNASSGEKRLNLKRSAT